MAEQDTNSLDAETQGRIKHVMGMVDKITTALREHDPLLEHHCKNIREALREQEELVHILPEKVIHEYLAGWKKLMNIQIAKEVSETKRRKKTTADDL